MLKVCFEVFFFLRERVKKEGKGKKTYDDLDMPSFFDEVESRKEGLSLGQGCYIFGYSHSGGMKPFYVGQTLRDFKQEILDSHKQGKIRDFLQEEHGKPVICLICLVSSATGKPIPGKKSGTSDARKKLIDKVEDLLIGRALERNEHLRNDRGISFWRDVVIPGVLNDKGYCSKDATLLKMMLNGPMKSKQCKKKLSSVKEGNTGE